MLETVVTPGNVHDSVAFDDVYDKVTVRFPEVETVVADSAYKTPHICKKVFEDGRVLSTGHRRWRAGTNGGNMCMTHTTTASFARSISHYPTARLTGMDTGNTRAIHRYVQTVGRAIFVLTPRLVWKRYSGISGRIMRNWPTTPAIHRSIGTCTSGARRPSNASLRTPKRSTPCGILSTEACPRFPTGSGLSSLPWISKSLPFGNGETPIPFVSFAFTRFLPFYFQEAAVLLMLNTGFFDTLKPAILVKWRA